MIGIAFVLLPSDNGRFEVSFVDTLMSQPIRKTKTAG